MQLYRLIDVDEETPVQFVGVYTTKWQPAWGEPTAMFYEATEDDLVIAAAQVPEVRAVVEALREVQWVEYRDQDICPRCANLPREGHKSGCDIAEALAPFEEVT